MQYLFFSYCRDSYIGLVFGGTFRILLTVRSLGLPVWSVGAREKKSSALEEKKYGGQPVKLNAPDVLVIGISSLALRKSGESAQTYFVQHIKIIFRGYVIISID